MLKPVITATALAALAGSSITYAQHGFGDGDWGFGDRGPHAEYRHHLSTADISAFADAGIAALRAGLQLTPDQEKELAALRTGFARHGSAADPARASASSGG